MAQNLIRTLLHQRFGVQTMVVQVSNHQLANVINARGQFLTLVFFVAILSEINQPSLRDGDSDRCSFLFYASSIALISSISAGCPISLNRYYKCILKSYLARVVVSLSHQCRYFSLVT
jgi:hypothetical protein